MPQPPVPIAVLASGGGSNLQALLERFHGMRDAPVRVALVVASRGEIGALARADAFGVDSLVLSPRELGPEAFGAALLRETEARGIGMLVLAGWLQLVPAAVVARFRGRMVNVHPALLPAFGGRGMYGMHVHRAVIASGARVSGATVHLVDDRYDEGPILAQWPVPVLPGDTPEALAARVLAVEHRILPNVVEALARGGIDRQPVAGPVCFDLAPARAPRDESIRTTMRMPPSPSSDQP